MSGKSDSNEVDFGFATIARSEKARRVRGVFDSVASRYDVMNDLMSLGVHRLWKRLAVNALVPRPGGRMLDVAGGTGDLTRLMANKVGATGSVTLTDINGAMLSVGRDRLLNNGLVSNIDVVQANAESLPFKPDTFDGAIIAFGLRNVTERENALRSMFDVLRPGGRLVVLEFSKVIVPMLAQMYDQYSFRILPKLGSLIAGDADSYQYLAESIRRFPDQQTLLQMMSDAGFVRSEFFNLSGGIVAIHRGVKP